MSEVINFGEWYKDRGLAYMFNKFNRGTNCFIRGEIDELVEFIYHLDRKYHPNSPTTRSNEIKIKLQEVLDTGKYKFGDVICFGDDRIRSVHRLDDELCNQNNGPFLGSAKHLEMQHNEQYGGEYPAEPNPFISSRAWMIEYVLLSIKNMER